MIRGVRGIVYRWNLLRERARRWLVIRRVGSTDFAIIAANCWGGEAYEELGRQYNTPFVGLFVHAPCYVRILGNLPEYLGADLSFTNKSRYLDQISYPIGLLKDAEIHFVHYRSEGEAREKWMRRLARMPRNPAKLRVMMCDRDHCTGAELDLFERLPFPHKVAFTARPFPQFPHVVWMEESREEPFVAAGDRLYRDCRDYFDVADWLRGGHGSPLLPYRMARFFLG
jgi:uncharacterized protein (DUF1919 family)